MEHDNASPDRRTARQASRSFDERAYLLANPDVAAAIVRGEVASGQDHYFRYGAAEARDPFNPDLDPAGQVILTTTAFAADAAHLTHFLETIIISRSGGIFIVGWIDDSSSALERVRLTAPGWRLSIDESSIARVRRADVEDALGKPIAHSFGYFGFHFAGRELGRTGELQVEFFTASGARAECTCQVRMVEDTELRDIVLQYLAEAHHFGNQQIKAIACVDRMIGGQLVNLNTHITRNIVAAPYVEWFGNPAARPKGSIIVCLYGRAEYLFLQNALHSGGAGIEDYEFIFVSNSPELSERLLNDARASSLLYGVNQGVVILPGNAGFGAANNAAVRASRSDRVVSMNPDVFPREAGWAAKHSALLSARPASETRIFGVPLYYDDGSLMHGGMYFEIDHGLSIEGFSMQQSQLIRVEHYGKGAPGEGSEFARPRPVPAVTGAFISAERQWYETLGGFTEDYIFGHYEDADLCLKSMERGVAPWLQDLHLWHLEGKGSTRRPVHEGGSLVNRWLFSTRWGGMVREGLLGPHPTHDLLKI